MYVCAYVYIYIYIYIYIERYAPGWGAHGEGGHCGLQGNYKTTARGTQVGSSLEGKTPAGLVERFLCIVTGCPFLFACTAQLA